MKAAFFDIDGTLTEERVWGGIMEYFSIRKQRRITNFLFLVYHYGLYFLYRLGLIDQLAFRAPWAEHLSWYFRGYSTEQAAEMWDWVVKQRISKMWRQDVRRVLEQHKQAGELVFLVSGGPQGLLERIVCEVGADYAVGTRHEKLNGRYTGRAASVACQGQGKVTLTQQRLSELGLQIDLAGSYAYADSAGDIPLLQLVGHPVAVYPDEELASIAQQRGWRIFPSK